MYVPTLAKALEDARTSLDHCRRGIGNPIEMISVVLEQVDAECFSLADLGTTAQELIDIVERYEKREEKKLVEKKKVLKQKCLELAITLNAL